jgi:hypothetical protein
MARRSMKMSVYLGGINPTPGANCFFAIIQTVNRKLVLLTDSPINKLFRNTIFSLLHDT